MRNRRLVTDINERISRVETIYFFIFLCCPIWLLGGVAIPLIAFGAYYHKRVHGTKCEIPGKTCPPKNELLKDYTEIFDKVVGSSCDSVPQEQLHTITPINSSNSIETLTKTITPVLASVRDYFDENGSLCKEKIEKYCRPPAGLQISIPNAPLDYPAINGKVLDSSCYESGSNSGWVAIAWFILLALTCICISALIGIRQLHIYKIRHANTHNNSSSGDSDNYIEHGIPRFDNGPAAEIYRQDRNIFDDFTADPMPAPGFVHTNFWQLQPDSAAIQVYSDHERAVESNQHNSATNPPLF